MVSRGDGFKVIATGRQKQAFTDMYARLLGGSWKNIVFVMVGLYFLINTIFALAYFAIGDGIEHARPDSFADAFFFSVQTLATIGYGGMAPHGMASNILVTIESMFGFAYYGVVTGLVFSKFSRPTARILFSDKAVITTHEGKPHFMLRLVNERDNRIVDAAAKLTLMRDEKTPEGLAMRRFYSLPLVRSEAPILRLTWTVMHEINEKSPLHGMTPERLAASESEIIISIVGLDETLSQTVHARHSYIADEIVCDAMFEDILHRREDYVLEVRYDLFHKLKEEISSA
jgi:inward rectifier potassium channel